MIGLPKADDRIPEFAIHPTEAAVLVAVGRGARTIREVSAAVGLASSSSAHHHLRILRRAGWVDWDDGTAGSLHPTFAVVDGRWRR